MTEVLESKCCTSCRKEFPMDQFIGERHTVITKTCKNCREINKLRDSTRDKVHRNEVARKNEANPERKAVKAKWSEENYDKVARKWMDYRQRKIETLGVEQYLKQQAEQAKKWRDNNPDKMVKANEDKKNDKENNYKIYKRNADIKNLDFIISYDDYINIVAQNCYYCSIVQERGFNGIDRKDQTKGYILENCVSCCKMCNYLKGSTSDDVFIKRVQHILTFQQKIIGNLYPECFANHISVSYSSYKSRATKKQLEFSITHQNYDDIINNDCYLCGKPNDDNHTNGIDRLDNSKGYLIDNVKSCCCECNYMKKDYDFDDIINKFILIYENHKNNQCCENVLITNNNIIVRNYNKKSKEEIQEHFIKQKKIKQGLLVENYNDSEGIKRRAKEIAENRNKK